MEPARLDRDRPCGACGYNLRGLELTGACPECGLAIVRSLSDEPIEWSDPRWVRSLHRGCALVILGQPPFLTGMFSGWWGARDRVISYGVPIGLLLCAIGAWLIATANPGPDQNPKYRASRIGIRATCLAPLVISLFPRLLLLLPLVWGSCVFFTFYCLHQLARRGRFQQLSAWTGFLRWALPVGMLAPLPFAMMLVLSGAGYDGLLFGMVASVPTGIWIVVCYLASLFVLIAFARRKPVDVLGASTIAATPPLYSAP